MKRLIYFFPVALILLGAGCSNATPKDLLAKQISTIESNLNGPSLYPSVHFFGNSGDGVVENIGKCRDYIDSPNCYSEIKQHQIVENFWPHRLSTDDRVKFMDTMKPVYQKYMLRDIACNDTIIACSDLLSFSKWEEGFVLYPELFQINTTLDELRDSAVHVGSYGLLKNFGPGNGMDDSYIETKELDLSVVSAVPNKVKKVLQELSSIKQEYGIK